MSLSTLKIVTAALVGLAVGQVLFSDRTKVQELERKLNQLSRAKANALVRDKTQGRTRAQLSSASSTPAMPLETDEFGLNAHERALSRDREERMRQGEYFLDSERPLARKVSEQATERYVSEKAQQDAAEYGPLLAQLGIDPLLAGQLAAHITKVCKASLEAEISMRQLLEARARLEDRLRSSLGDEGYTRFAQYEQAKPAAREYELLENFISSRSNVTLNTADATSIKALIQAAQAYTEDSWQGPLDRLPEPGFGLEMVVGQLEKKIQHIQDRSSDLLRKASEAGLSDTYKALLQSYYTQAIGRTRSEIQTAISRAGSLEHPRPIGR